MKSSAYNWHDDVIRLGEVLKLFFWGHHLVLQQGLISTLHIQLIEYVKIRMMISSFPNSIVVKFQHEN